MQPQGVTENIDAARRDSRLLRMAFRRARQSGDYRGALAASQLGDQMGLQIGTTVHDEAIKGLGMRRFRDSMEMDRRFGGPLGSGMDSGAQDAAGQQQLGVGGYDFNQQYGSPLAPQQQQPSTLDLQRAVARRKWQMAKTTEEKDAITEESAAKGLTTNPSAVQDALMRRRGNFGVPQLAAGGGSQQQTAASNETIPLRPNSQLGGPPSDKVMEGYTEYRPGASGWVRPIKSGISSIASAGQFIKDNQDATAAIESEYQGKIKSLERLNPNYSRFQKDLEQGYADSVRNASSYPDIPPDETMRQQLLKSRSNERKNKFRTLRDFYGKEQRQEYLSPQDVESDAKVQGTLGDFQKRQDDIRRNRNMFTGMR